MDYKQWDYRGISFFKEEIIDSEEKNTNNEHPSIKGFQQNSVYSSETRHQLYNYLKSCSGIVSTSYRRLNAYTFEPIFSLTYFTDGEFIFTNLLLEYIQYDDFVLPEKWFELIKMRNYINDHFEFNYERMFSGEIDIFKNFERNFQEPSIIKLIIL